MRERTLDTVKTKKTYEPEETVSISAGKVAKLLFQIVDEIKEAEGKFGTFHMVAIKTLEGIGENGKPIETETNRLDFSSKRLLGIFESIFATYDNRAKLYEATFLMSGAGTGFDRKYIISEVE